MEKWKEWLKAAGIRAVRTFAESALAYVGTGAVAALLLALSGLPEVGKGESPEKA